jgi:hypothetical protein
MRYFTVTYARKANGQMDELVGVTKKLKMNDYQTCAVILDFKTGTVVQASMGGVTVPKDFLKIRDFYQKHYDRLIRDLESVYGRYELGEPIIPGLDEDPTIPTKPDNS